MPKYAALIYRVEAETPAQGAPESAEVYRAWGTFNRDVGEAKVLASGTGLQPTAGNRHDRARARRQDPLHRRAVRRDPRAARRGVPGLRVQGPRRGAPVGQRRGSPTHRRARSRSPLWGEG